MSIAETKTWATLAYQDALRPPVGMRTGWALLTTYSAELRGVAAALLALAGSERENSGGTAMQLASAVQQLRGRVHVALQSGRLARPRGVRQKMGVMLDSSQTPCCSKTACFQWYLPRYQSIWAVPSQGWSVEILPVRSTVLAPARN